MFSKTTHPNALTYKVLRAAMRFVAMLLLFPSYFEQRRMPASGNMLTNCCGYTILKLFFTIFFSTAITYSYKLPANCALPLLLYCPCAINLLTTWLSLCQLERIVAAITKVTMVGCHSRVCLLDLSATTNTYSSLSAIFLTTLSWKGHENASVIRRMFRNDLSCDLPQLKSKGFSDI